MSNLKVEGKVADFCPRCKNCKSTTREWDGEKDWLTEVECEDPYDGMIKTLAADSDICCSMFAPKSDHGRYPWGKDKTENESIYSELIKASKRKDELIQSYREKLKKANDENNLLNSKLDKLGECYRTDEKLIDNIQKVIFPQEEGSDYTYGYGEILNKVKELKVQSKYEKLLNDILEIVYEHPEMFERNMNAYELLPGRVKFLKNSWDMMCDKYDPLYVENEQRKKAMDNQFNMIQERDAEIERLKKIIDETDITKVLKLEAQIKNLQVANEESYKREEELEKKLHKADSIRDAVWNVSELKQKISDLTEKNENLTKMVERRDKWVEELKSDVDTLQNECLVIAEIAKRAYDETNRD